MSININITFMHISRFILASKSSPFTFFHMNIRTLITFFHGRFMYIHTFFHYKMLCGCRLITCLYDIRQTSYECRLHHSLVAPSEPIWATFAPILGKYIPTADSSRHEPTELPQPFCAGRPYYIYVHICRGKWRRCNLHIRTWENLGRFFSCRSIICTVYYWEKCKKL